jgi:hypothetical protein
MIGLSYDLHEFSRRAERSVDCKTVKFQRYFGPDNVRNRSYIKVAIKSYGLELVCFYCSSYVVLIGTERTAASTFVVQ